MRLLSLAVLLLVGCSGGAGGKGKNKGPGTESSPPAEGDLWVTHEQRTSDADGLFEVQVEVTSEVNSFQVTGKAGDYRVSLEQLIDPSGKVILTWEDWYTSPRSLTMAFFGYDPVTAFNWPVRAVDGPLDEGTYTVRLSTLDASGYYVKNKPVDITVDRKRDQDLDEAIVSVQIVWADGVEDDPDVVAGVEGAVERWREIWGDHGITLNEYYVSSSLDPGLGFAQSGSEGVAQLPKDPGDLRLIIGEKIMEQNDLYGLSAGVPGTVDSSTHTWVLLSWWVHAGVDGVLDDGERNLMGETMAHEVGHYTGMFHPVESNYQAWDAIGDTEECSAWRKCDEALGTNLMYPYPVCDYTSCVAQGDLTTGQLGVTNRYVGAL